MCILRVFGSGFDPESFLAESGFEADRVYRRGEPRGRRGRIHETSGFTVVVSGADPFRTQVANASAFLTMHTEELRRLQAAPEVDGVVLDFPIYFDLNGDTWAAFAPIPANLVKLAGELGLGFEVSFYPSSETDEDDTCPTEH